ncbi:olfactory receptor 14A2-like [Tachyglossus aculeatus]|uniref:olfactory receptor 14A2-like n=1 Tax=Tachyglossus aculeatus TaxID=9261 RepID=UPI0018F6E1EA|nr:olfactory receptor 14A2-like [Tachyglossus aculeatus]
MADASWLSGACLITCSETHITIDETAIFGTALGVVCFISIVFLYMYIFWAVLRMPAAEGQTKALSIHLTKPYENLQTSILCYKAVWMQCAVLQEEMASSTFSLSFCRTNAVQQFFFDVPSLLKITCSEDHVAIDAAWIVLGIVCFILIIVSYVRIFRAMLRMLAVEGRGKAFSICLPYFGVIILFVMTYSLPDLLVSVFNTVVTPFLNPLIYSLRNRDVKFAMV